MSEATNSEQENSVLSPPTGFKLRCTLPGHSEIITQIAWSADGKKLATASQDRTIRIWNTEAGELVFTLEGHTDIVLDITWSPDGSTLASTSKDKTMRLWDINTGKQSSEIKNEYAKAIACSPHGNIFASKMCFPYIELKFWDESIKKEIKNIETKLSVSEKEIKNIETKLSAIFNRIDIDYRLNEINQSRTNSIIRVLKSRQFKIINKFGNRDKKIGARNRRTEIRLGNTVIRAKKTIAMTGEITVLNSDTHILKINQYPESFSNTRQSHAKLLDDLEEYKRLGSLVWSSNEQMLAVLDEDQISINLVKIDAVKRKHLSKKRLAQLKRVEQLKWKFNEMLSSSKGSHTPEIETQMSLVIKLYTELVEITELELVVSSIIQISLESINLENSKILNIAWSPDSQLLASAILDGTIMLWDIATRSVIRVLEGHADAVTSVSFSCDGRFLVSKSLDNSVRLWNCQTWETVAVIHESTSGKWLSSAAFNPKLPVLATLGERDTIVHIWELDIPTLLRAAPVSSSVHYANAKVVLVGDTGVGKSGLGLVLSNEHFKPTESTHGRRVWTFEKQGVVASSQAQTRETMLWDLAGQPGYRLIHQLHLNEVAVALIVFDTRSETDPFAGVRHWDRALTQAQRFQSSGTPSLKKFLVAARADRGGIGVSRKRIDTWVKELGFDGYFETSAKEGWQIPELVAAIRNSIDWNALPSVSSTKLFQQIKDFLINEKKAERLLSTVDDLYRAFLQSENAPAETNSLRPQFEVCIGRVESRDLIRRLSFGNYVLLQPELLDAYASALINAAKDEPDGLGNIAEEDARHGRFRMSEDERIKDKALEELLLIATVEELLCHELVLRESADDGTYLVFPSQFTREWPDAPNPQGQAVIFEFEGAVLNIYATLAVRLTRSGLFIKQDLWKNAATYRAKVGGLCGMSLREIQEGKGELTLFFDRAASEQTRSQFENYICSDPQY